MADPTVVCRSCGVSATHAPGDPMALCPYCGAALPVTLDVREAQAAEARALAELQRVRRPEPLWVSGDAMPRRRAGGIWLWVLVALAAAAAVAAWARGGFVIP